MIDVDVDVDGRVGVGVRVGGEWGCVQIVSRKIGKE
jgi:hypothetical protein